MHDTNLAITMFTVAILQQCEKEKAGIIIANDHTLQEHSSGKT